MPVEKISTNNLSFGKRKVKASYITYKSPIKAEKNRRKAKAVGMMAAFASTVGIYSLIKNGKLSGKSLKKFLTALKNIPVILLGFLVGVYSYFKKENKKEEVKESFDNENTNIAEIPDNEDSEPIEVIDKEEPVEVIDESSEEDNEPFIFDDEPVEKTDESIEEENPFTFDEEPVEVIDKEEQIDNIEYTENMLNEMTGKKIHKSQPVEFEEGFFEEIADDKPSKPKSGKFDDDYIEKMLGTPKKSKSDDESMKLDNLFIQELVGSKESKSDDERTKLDDLFAQELADLKESESKAKTEPIKFDDSFLEELFRPSKKESLTSEEMDQYIRESLSDVPPSTTPPDNLFELGKRAEKEYKNYLKRSFKIKIK